MENIIIDMLIANGKSTENATLINEIYEMLISRQMIKLNDLFIYNSAYLIMENGTCFILNGIGKISLQQFLITQ